MKIELTQRERLLVAILYLITLVFVYQGIGGDVKSLIGSKSNDNAIWFFSGALMIVLGKYLVETYFTKPADAVVNAIAVLSGLILISNKNIFWGYEGLLAYTLTVLILAMFCIATKDSENERLQKVSKFCYLVVGKLGQSVVIFSLIYLSASYSYFGVPDKIIPLIVTITLWVVLVFFDVFGLLVKNFKHVFKLFTKEKADILGVAIGCENPFLYKVEIDLDKHRVNPDIEYGALVAIEIRQNTGSLGMVIDKKYLLGKRWLSVYLFADENSDHLTIGLRSRKLITDPNSVFRANDCVYAIDIESLSEEQKEAISKNHLFKNKEGFVGYVTSGSNINTISFSIIKDTKSKERRISEGSILETSIYGEEVIYQVINGDTKEEHLENQDSHGYTVGIARKLGHYNKTKKVLDVKKWMPSIYTPLFFSSSTANLSKERLREIAAQSIGRLPDTDLEIPISDLDSIVTHNTAILGILGIGKSRLAFELIKKVADNKTKVFCIDITNQYYSDNGLFKYIPKEKISFDLPDTKKAELKASKDSNRIEGNPQVSGNSHDYIARLDEDIKSFLENDDLLIKVFNPDLHPVSKGVAFKNTSLEDLTMAEKTRAIAERIFMYAMKQGVSDKAKYALVFEEAHSLVPEWNSVANEGDKSATNGTAKVILQGRKFGLGSIVVTQRTANISKSILNQCNTVFALRIFDDTGKDFLANYIGKDYSDALATLEERHAVAIGKGLSLKQPVIIQLNDTDDLIQGVTV